MSEGRYCVQRMTFFDLEDKLEVWKTTKYCSDHLTTLYSFLAEGYRIWDTLDNVVIYRSWGSYDSEE